MITAWKLVWREFARYRIFTWLKPKLDTNALGCAQYLPSRNLQICRVSAPSRAVRNLGPSYSSELFQKIILLLKKKPNHLFRQPGYIFQDPRFSAPTSQWIWHFLSMLSLTMKKLKVKGYFTCNDWVYFNHAGMFRAVPD